MFGVIRAMVTETEQTYFNLTIVCEGLNSLASSSDVQLSLNRKGLVHLDDVFDPMPLDYLPWLEENNTISCGFASKLRDLYDKIDNVVGDMEWQEKDEYISNNTVELQQWRQVAVQLLSEINCV